LQNFLEKLGSWFLGIAAAGIISGLCAMLAPENGKKAVKFAGGLLVMLAVLLPIRSLSGYNPVSVLERYEAELASRIASLTNSGAADAAGIIEDQTEDYIENKVEELGYSCTADVVVKKNQQGFLAPYSVTVIYRSLPADDILKTVKALIEEQTGIPKYRQSHK
jgi:hypothetical protein